VRALSRLAQAGRWASYKGNAHGTAQTDCLLVPPEATRHRRPRLACRRPHRNHPSFALPATPGLVVLVVVLRGLFSAVSKTSSNVFSAST